MQTLGIQIDKQKIVPSQIKSPQSHHVTYEDVMKGLDDVQEAEELCEETNENAYVSTSAINSFRPTLDISQPHINPKSSFESLSSNSEHKSFDYRPPSVA